MPDVRGRTTGTALFASGFLTSLANKRKVPAHVAWAYPGSIGSDNRKRLSAWVMHKQQIDGSTTDRLPLHRGGGVNLEQMCLRLTQHATQAAAGTCMHAYVSGRRSVGGQPPPGGCTCGGDDAHGCHYCVPAATRCSSAGVVAGRVVHLRRRPRLRAQPASQTIDRWAGACRRQARAKKASTSGPAVQAGLRLDTPSLLDQAVRRASARANGGMGASGRGRGEGKGDRTAGARQGVPRSITCCIF